MRWLAVALVLAPATAQASTFEADGLALTVGAHVDAFYSYVLTNPENGINNARIFDTRHNTFALSSAGLSLDAELEEFAALRFAIWFGLTSEAIYAAEPVASSAGVVGGSDADLWQHVMEAYAALKFPVGRGLDLEAGLFVSPLGLESIMTKDNWNYSSSNLNYMLPFYHAGARLRYHLTKRLALTLGVYNGWTGVVDANDGKSIALSTAGTFGRLAWGTTFWWGNERPSGAPEGKRWLHHFDAWGKVRFLDWLWIGAQVDAGFEPNVIAVNWWAAWALYVRASIGRSPIFVTLRADWFRDSPGTGDDGRVASPLFHSVEWVSSVTTTIEVAPVSGVSLKLEHRHDEAGGPLYFGADVGAPTEKRQDVLTAALVAWF